MTQDTAERQLAQEAPEEREVVAGRAPATPFVMLAAVGGVVLAAVALALVIVVVAGWAA